jgi:hypothetical protein
LLDSRNISLSLGSNLIARSRIRGAQSETIIDRKSRTAAGAEVEGVVRLPNLGDLPANTQASSRIGDRSSSKY